ncbi:hypothetical protein N431DRAFT_479470 [Stipitochalara longipes BDJ]|nr:hypothetical protein N431DRAFT_479470 [Stipitochalara longipes BDJ]
MDNNFTKALVEALPSTWDGVDQPFPGNWPAFVQAPGWNIVTKRLEHSPMDWTTSVHLLCLDGADIRDDYPGFGRRLEYEDEMEAEAFTREFAEEMEREEKAAAIASQASPANPPTLTDPSTPPSSPHSRPRNLSPRRHTRRSSRSRSPRGRSRSPIGRTDPGPATTSRREEREQAKERAERREREHQAAVKRERAENAEMEDMIERAMREEGKRLGISGAGVNDEDNDDEEGSDEGEIRE